MLSLYRGLRAHACWSLCPVGPSWRQLRWSGKQAGLREETYFRPALALLSEGWGYLSRFQAYMGKRPQGYKTHDRQGRARRQSWSMEKWVEGPAWASSGTKQGCIATWNVYTKRCRPTQPSGSRKEHSAGLSIGSSGCRMGILEPLGASSR